MQVVDGRLRYSLIILQHTISDFLNFLTFRAHTIAVCLKTATTKVIEGFTKHELTYKVTANVSCKPPLAKFATVLVGHVNQLQPSTGSEVPVLTAFWARKHGSLIRF